MLNASFRRVGHQGRLRPVFDGAMAARLRGVPTIDRAASTELGSGGHAAQRAALPTLPVRAEDHSPICARYAFQNPRTAASLTRLSAEATLAPPISTTESRSGAVATARCTKPGAAPSSIEM